jgi:hypothetical protein
MKTYKILLIGLKVIFLVQFCAIILGFEKEDSGAYLMTDFVFKFVLGVFLMVFFHITHVKEIRGWNARFIEFGGGLLAFDAWFNSLPKALLKYGIYYEPYTFVIKRVDTVKSVGGKIVVDTVNTGEKIVVDTVNTGGQIVSNITN